MVYPENVDREMKNVGKLTGQSRTQVIIYGIITLSIISLFVLRSLFSRFFGLGFAWSIIAQLVITSSVLIFCFRFFVVKEDEKMEEYENSDSDSFVKFIKIRKDTEQIIKLNNGLPISTFDFVNGNNFCIICFKFGENNAVKAEATRRALEMIFSTLYTNNLEHREFCMPENFENSVEYKRYVSQINSIEDKKLANHLMLVAREVLNFSKEYSNVDCIYMLISTKTSTQQLEMTAALNAVVNILDSSNTAFREYRFLNVDEVFEFYESFSGLEVIDISMIKALDTEIDRDDLDSVSLYGVITTNNRRFINNSVLNPYFVVKERKLTDD